MTATRSGIPTTHADTNFRSRLEARWAAFFDLVGWSWVYEPFDADGYIPDFLITGPAPFLVEVGPCMTIDQYREKRTKPMAAYPQSQEWVGVSDGQILLDTREWWTVVVGASPLLQTSRWRCIAIGLWATINVGMPDFDDVEPAFWHRCPACGGFSIDPPSLGRFGSSIGCSAPCDHPEAWSGPLIAPGELDAIWRRAGNDVQWKPERVSTILDRL